MTTLREALRNRALRRPAHLEARAARSLYAPEVDSQADREAVKLAADIAAGLAVTIPFETLKGALWEAGLVTADELTVLNNRAARWIVEPDGTYVPA